MIQTLSDRIITARKTHTCWQCGRPIPKGSRYRAFVGKCDHVYRLRMHDDCAAAAWWLAARLGVDISDGIPPLEVMVHDDGSAEAQRIIDAMRGRFPHPACRLEFRLQAPPFMPIAR